MRRSPRKQRQEPIQPVAKRTNSDNNGESPRPPRTSTQDHRNPAKTTLEEDLVFLSNLQRRQEQEEAATGSEKNKETPRQPAASRARLTPPEVILANFKRKLDEKDIAKEKEKTIKKQQEMLRAAKVEKKAILAQLKAAEEAAKARTAALGDSMAQEVARKERQVKVNCSPIYVSSVLSCFQILTSSVRLRNTQLRGHRNFS